MTRNVKTYIVKEILFFGAECFMRVGSGYRLHRQIIVMTLNVATLYDCELICANERKFTCNIFSFRYSTFPATDNCMMGERMMRRLDFYSDLVKDRDHDVYIRNEHSKPGCQPTKNWDNDCFERIRSGLRLDSSMVRFSVNVDSLLDCELICLHVRHFICRAFSFKFRSSPNDYNCLLTDYPATDMDSRRHFIEDANCELYNRGSFGHGCEIGRWPHTGFIPWHRKGWRRRRPMTTTLPPPPPSLPPLSPPPPLQPSPPMPSLPVPSSPDKSTIITVTTNIYACYPYMHGQYPTTAVTPYNPGHPIYRPAIGRPYWPAKSPPSQPRFRPHRPVWPTHPKYPPGDRQPGLWPGRGHHPGVYTRKLDRICYVAYGTPARLKPAAVAGSVVVANEQECKAECSRARESSKFRCATVSYWSGHCELSDVELRDLKPGYDFIGDERFRLFSWDFANPRCYMPSSTPLPDGVWSTFTVSGRRCKWGTHCSDKYVAGIWSCPIDDGDWDYCCRPNHHCGYSEGYNYPWCYVGGASRQQWRPCSDFYYPYDKRHRGAPHWPISYVHRQGPPNNAAEPPHHPSLLDSFFEQLRFDPSNGSSASNASEGRSNGHNNSSVPTFKDVNITEPTQTNTIDFSSLWNLSESSNESVPSQNTNRNSTKIIPSKEREKVKKRTLAKKSPNII